MEEPFLGSEALSSGRLTRHELRTKFVAVHQDVYMSSNTELTPVVPREGPAGRRSRRRGVLVGFSASAVHGAKWISHRPACGDQRHQPQADPWP